MGGIFTDLENTLYGKHYKLYIPLLVVLLGVCLFVAFVFPGVKQGIDLRGGTMLIVRMDTPIDADSLETLLKDKFPLTDVRVTSTSAPGGVSGAVIEFTDNTELAIAEAALAEAKALLAKDKQAAGEKAKEAIAATANYAPQPPTAGLPPEDLVELAGIIVPKAEEAFDLQLQDFVKAEFSLGEEAAFQKREVGPILGKTFYESAITVGIIGFILITLVVFAFFREFIPAVAIIFAAVFDMAAALAGMAVFNISLSLSTIPALLMLIGYSVDTDILLTTRLLKRVEGTPKGRAISAMKTGLTMTATALAALVVMLFFSYIWQIMVMFEISAVILFGLLGDIIVTWSMNAAVLLWYVERKGGK
ncbi:MAG: hypothetical protein V1676_02775 [Candidatus Diapherotrites archaeon]